MFIGGFLAAAKVHRRSGNFLSRFVLFGLIMLAVAGIISFFAATQAQGYGEVDSSTIGIGASQSSNATAIDSQTRLGVSSNNENQDNAVSEALDPSDGAQRSITVKDPDPVIAQSLLTMRIRRQWKREMQFVPSTPCPPPRGSRPTSPMVPGQAVLLRLITFLRTITVQASSAFPPRLLVVRSMKVVLRSLCQPASLTCSVAWSRSAIKTKSSSQRLPIRADLASTVVAST